MASTCRGASSRAVRVVSHFSGSICIRHSKRPADDIVATETVRLARPLRASNSASTGNSHCWNLSRDNVAGDGLLNDSVCVLRQQETLADGLFRGNPNGRNVTLLIAVALLER
jgi:hypothetical protein